MSYGQRLRMQRSADGRVLKAQLNLIADVLHAARFIAPLWAICAALLVSDVGGLGDTPIAIAMAPSCSETGNALRRISVT